MNLTRHQAGALRQFGPPNEDVAYRDSPTNYWRSAPPRRPIKRAIMRELIDMGLIFTFIDNWRCTRAKLTARGRIVLADMLAAEKRKAA